MKLFILLSIFALAVATSNTGNVVNVVENAEPSPNEVSAESRNILVNALVNQMFAYVRRIINNGSLLFNIPPLDPLRLDHFHLQVPAGLINLEIEVKNVFATGFGGFVVNTGTLNVRELTFDIDITFPNIEIETDDYDFVGDLFTAIPLYGKGTARFEVENFSFAAKLYLKQSDDEQSVLIDRIENPSFKMPVLRSKLTGAIGGGNIDNVVNAIIQEVFADYVNRFNGVISKGASRAIITVGNPILDQLNTWRFIRPFV